MRTETPVIDFLLEYNKEQSAIYCDPGETLWRIQHAERHPTRIASLECMDGRVNIANMTKTPTGIIRSFRNVGGIFDLGYDYFSGIIDDWATATARSKANGIIFVSYHWSRKHKECGCAGFNKDVYAAQAYTRTLKREIETLFGKSHSVIYPVQIGIETDEDALVLYGEDGSIFDVGRETECFGNNLAVRLKAMFPDMSASILSDLQTLVENNEHHVNSVRASGKPSGALDHQERILAVGRTFGWYRRINEAVIVGPYSYNMEKPIAIGAHILLGNLKDERISVEDGVVLMTSSAYESEAGTGRRRAEKISRAYAKHALDVISEREPELIEHLSLLSGVINTETQRFSRIEFE